MALSENSINQKIKYAIKENISEYKILIICSKIYFRQPIYFDKSQLATIFVLPFVFCFLILAALAIQIFTICDFDYSHLILVESNPLLM